MRSMSELALLTVDGRIARLTLNRAEKRNALSIDLLEALHARVDELAGRLDVSVCVLTGDGPTFCAGMDLKAVMSDPAAARKLLSLLAELTLKIRALPMTVIARVNGAAVGGGCGLVAVADIAYTHPDSKLGYPEVDLGVCPAVVAPWLVRAVGAATARRILLQGGTMTGHRAWELGLVAHCVPKEELDQAVEDAAARLAAAGPNALRATKSLLNELDGDALAAAVRKGAVLSAEVIGGEEAQRMLRAVLGKA